MTTVTAMSLRFHEISESRHRILNPLSADKLRLIGEICQLDESMHLLDLCCGKAEMLCTWAAAHSVSGIGVDISEVFLAEARGRAAELDVEGRVSLVHADAAQYVVDSERTFDVVCCIGATWIGGGLTGTLELMRPRCSADGLVVVGEPFWIEPPPPDVTRSVDTDDDDFVSLAGTAKRIESAGFDLVEMVAASNDDWDRYVAMQWMTVDAWLREHREHPDAAPLGAWIRAARRRHLEYRRRYLGWGVFVLRPAP